MTPTVGDRAPAPCPTSAACRRVTRSRVLARRRRRAAPLRQRRRRAPVPAAGHRDPARPDLRSRARPRRRPARTGARTRAMTLGAAARTRRRRSSPSIWPRRSAPADRARAVAGVEFDSRRVVPGSVFVGMKGEKADGAAYAQQALVKGALRGGRRGAGAGRLDAAVDQGRRRSRRAGGAGGGVLRPPERRPARRRHHRHQRQDHDQLPAPPAIFDEGGVRCGRIGTVSYDVGGERARRAADDAGVDRLPAHAARDGDQRLRRLRGRGVVARAGAEARRLRALRGRRLHQPDPRSPRLPPRHGVVLRGQAAAVRAAAAGRDRGGERRRSLRPRAGRRR